MSLNNRESLDRLNKSLLLLDCELNPYSIDRLKEFRERAIQNEEYEFVKIYNDEIIRLENESNRNSQNQKTIY